MQRHLLIKSTGMQMIEAREGRDIETLIRELYTEQGFTQDQIANRLGVSTPTVIRWMARLGIQTRWLGSRKTAV